MPRRCPQSMPMTEKTEEREEWYAIRVTYSRELLVKSYLDERGVANYVPMHFAERRYGGRPRKVWVPMVHNLLFVRTTAGRLREIKAGTELPIRYIMDRQTRTPIVIPEAQMHDFMAIVASRNEHVEIVTPTEIDLAQGDPVRITGGIFAGIRGRYIRHKGHSKVAVAIRDIAVALTAYVPAKFVEKLDERPLRAERSETTTRESVHDKVDTNPNYKTPLKNSNV